MPSKLASSSFATSRRPSTAPQTRDYQHLHITTTHRFGLPSSLRHGQLNRAKLVDLPPLGTEERSVEYLLHQGPTPAAVSELANTLITCVEVQDVSSAVGTPEIAVGLKSSSPARTQTEWKFLHDRHIEYLSTSKRRRDGQSMNIDHPLSAMSAPTPPPAYSPSMALNMSLEADVPAREQQVGVAVEIQTPRRRTSTTHIVPTLLYRSPAARLQQQENGANGEGAQPDTTTPPTSETSRSGGLWLTGRIARGTRRMFHHGLDPPPRPPRSSNRPVTADATLQSLSTSSTAVSHLSAPPDVNPPETLPIQHLAAENGASPLMLPPPLRILQPVHDREQDQEMPISPINLAQSQHTSPRQPSPYNGMPPSPNSSRWTYGTVPSRELPDPVHGSPEFEYSGELYPLERVQSRTSTPRPQSRERARHSRQSAGIIQMQLASNLRVEASDENGNHLRAPIIARSPDLSPWYTSISPSSSVYPVRDGGSSNSSHSDSADSRRPLRQTSASSPSAIQRGLSNIPYFGGGSRRSHSSRSPANSQGVPTGINPTRKGHLTELPAAIDADMERTHAIDALRGGATHHEPAASAERSNRERLQGLDTLPADSYEQAPDSRTYNSVNRASFTSSAGSRQEQQHVVSSGEVRSPASWMHEPLRLSRTRSTQRGSDAHEQLLTPKSTYSPSIQSQHDGQGIREASPFPRSKPRSPYVAGRHLGSADSGPEGRTQDHPAHDDPGHKQELQPSATMGTVSSASHYSSFHSFPSDTPLVEPKDALNPVTTAGQGLVVPQGTTYSAAKLLAAAERFERRPRYPAPVPESYRDFKPDLDDDRYRTSTLSSPVPGATEIPTATGTPIAMRPTPSDVQQGLGLELTPASEVHAEASKNENKQDHGQEEESGFGLGIHVPGDTPESPHGMSSVHTTLRDRIKGPMDRIIAGKAKEKKSDAQEHLRKQKESIFRHQSHLIAAKAEEGFRGFRNRRRSSQPILGGSSIAESAVEARKDSAKPHVKPFEKRLPVTSVSGRPVPESTRGRCCTTFRAIECRIDL